MNDETVRLPTYSRAVGGTDPHPVSVEKTIGQIDSQVDTVWANAELRGYLDGAETFLASVHELVTLAQSLEGLATARVEMLRSTAAAALGDQGDAYEALMERLHGDGVTR